MLRNSLNTDSDLIRVGWAWNWALLASPWRAPIYKPCCSSTGARRWFPERGSPGVNMVPGAQTPPGNLSEMLILGPPPRLSKRNYRDKPSSWLRSTQLERHSSTQGGRLPRWTKYWLFPTRKGNKAVLGLWQPSRTGQCSVNCWQWEFNRATHTGEWTLGGQTWPGAGWNSVKRVCPLHPMTGGTDAPTQRRGSVTWGNTTERSCPTEETGKCLWLLLSRDTKKIRQNFWKALTPPQKKHQSRYHGETLLFNFFTLILPFSVA